MLAQLKYGYDQVGNRLYRRDEVARSQTPLKKFDELYTYDGLNRLTDFDRGKLNANNTAITGTTIGQDWTLDQTGNWSGFNQTVADALTQTRTHNKVNEITAISETVGDQWKDPAHDANGNMTTMPQPKDLTKGYTATWDAWNRLVKLEEGANTVAEFEYDGLNRRTIKKKYTSGSLDETRHFYYSNQWQVLEERVDTATTADKQFVWGMRYVDDLVLRDTSSDRLYSLQDALFNVVALTDTSGAVKERFAYTPYGASEELNPDFTTYTGTEYNWEYRFTGRELDVDTGLQLNRNRYLHLELGRWVNRDPIGYLDILNLHLYANASPLNKSDSSGLSVDTGPANHDSICCKKVISVWEYWQYQSQAECVAHVLLMVSLRPGGALFGIGVTTRALINQAIGTGNWAGLIAVIGAGWLAKKTAEITCALKTCTRDNIIASKCTLYSYKPFPWAWWECYRTHCYCPVGSTLWDDKPTFQPWTDGPPNWDLGDLIEEAKEDWPG